MNDIKSIWSELDNNLIDNLAMDSEVQKSIIGNFQEEQELRKRYNPLLFLLIAAFAFVFVIIVQGQDSSMSTSKYIGITLVVLSGVTIAYYSQRVKMPFKNLTLDNSAIDFARLCNDYLIKARLSLVMGILLQLTLLSVGLYLLIFFDQTNSNWGMTTAFWGIMLSLCGFAVGGGIATFNKHYEGLFDMIKQYSKEDFDNYEIEEI